MKMLNLRRPIPGLPGYSVTRDGILYGPRGHALAKNKPSRSGHISYQLGKAGRTKIISEHIAVLTTWGGPRPDGMICRHLDGNPQNNHISNLRWGTHAENKADAIRHGTASMPTRGRGTQHSGSKLTEGDIPHIRALLGQGSPCSAIAARYGVAAATIRDIRERRTWIHVPDTAGAA